MAMDPQTMNMVAMLILIPTMAFVIVQIAHLWVKIRDQKKAAQEAAGSGTAASSSSSTGSDKT